MPKGKYRVDITVNTPRPTDEIPLLLVIKSVLDGINKEIIENDRQVYECNIRYDHKPVYSNASKSTSHESLKIEIFGMVSSGVPIIEVSDNFYIVPKQWIGYTELDNSLRV